MSRHKHTRQRPATRAERAAYHLEVAIVVATDRATSLESRRIDAPRLVVQSFLDSLPEDLTVADLREANLAPYQAQATTQAVAHG